MQSKLIPAICLILLLASCEKDPVDISQIQTLKDLTVPAGFKFSTTKDIEISVQLPLTVNYETTNRIIQIWSEGPDGDPGKLIKTGTANHTGLFEQILTIEASAKKLFIQTFAGWRTINLNSPTLKSGSSKFSADYNIGYGRTAPKSGRSNPLNSLIQNRSSINNSRFKSSEFNLVQNGDFSYEKLGSQESWWSPMEADGVWYSTDMVNSYSSIITEEKNGLVRIKTDQYIWGGITQLVKAAPGDILSFSADMRGDSGEMQYLYLYLIPRDENGYPLDFFYYENYGVTKDWVNGTVVGQMPNGTVSCEVLFWINASGIVDFDNAVVNGGNGSDDSDGDGVTNQEDQYPYDPGKAFNDFMPSAEDMGSCAFEDLWPSYGDFDFNDLVFDYRVNRISNAKNYVVQLDFLIRVRAIGASIRSGFGLQIYGLNPDAVDRIENRFSFTADQVLFNGNGTEQGQNYATIIFFDDAYKLLPHPGDKGPGVNTSPGYTYVEPQDLNITVYFKEPVENEAVGYDDLKPFIFYKNDRGHEIHLPGNMPTDLMNRKLLGTEDDASNPETGYYYQSKNGIPWAISTPIRFDYTIEKSEIIDGHLYFKEWAFSGGNKYQDWYYDYDGYRNRDYIYGNR